MSELLESRWQDTKTALLEGLQGTKKAVMGTTLENTRKYLFPILYYGIILFVCQPLK